MQFVLDKVRVGEGVIVEESVEDEDGENIIEVVVEGVREAVRLAVLQVDFVCV